MKVFAYKNRATDQWGWFCPCCVDGVDGYTPPAAANRYEAAGITRARNVAQQHGWVLPLAWDDDHGPHGIDNPHATPSTGSHTRALGSTVEDIEYLIDADETADAISARLGIRWNHLATTLRRNGRQDLLDRLNRRRAAA